MNESKYFLSKLVDDMNDRYVSKDDNKYYRKKKLASTIQRDNIESRYIQRSNICSICHTSISNNKVCLCS